MKLKYYLRGLGIGILVTALIMGIATGSRKQMSDEEVKARARELGMVENTTLSNIVNVLDKETDLEKETVSGDASADAAGTDSTEPDETKPPESKPAANEPEDTKPTETKPAETKPVETKPTETKQDGNKDADVNPGETIPGESVPSDTDSGKTPANDATPAVSEDTKPVTITIKSGESSVTVSKSLAEAGLVEDASSYDKYLCTNGYDKKIVTGTYHIPMGTSNEDIAKVITGKLSFD